MTMKSSVRDEEIRKMSTDISRKLLSDLAIKGSEHCDIIIDEYLSSSEKYDLDGAPHPLGFIDVGALIVSDIPKALICTAVVEVSKYFFRVMYHQIDEMSRGEKVETLSSKFSDEAIKMGLTPSQAEKLARKFTEILMVSPFLNP
jgi:hypothetical protein